MYPNESQSTGTMLDALPDVGYLLQKYSEKIKEIAPLRARYGGAGNYLGERLFKAEEAKLEIVVRGSIGEGGKLPDGIKATEGAIDAHVRTRDEYTKLLTDEVTGRTQWIMLEAEIKEIEWRLEARKADAYLLGREAGLQ